MGHPRLFQQDDTWGKRGDFGRGPVRLTRRPQQFDFRMGRQDRGDSISKEPVTKDQVHACHNFIPPFQPRPMMLPELLRPNTPLDQPHGYADAVCAYLASATSEYRHPA